MRRIYLAVSLSFCSFSISSCKTPAPVSEPRALTASTTSSSPNCAKPVEVEYKADATVGQKAAAIAKETTVGVGLFDLVNIEVKPDDFRSLDSHECKDDKTCTAVMTKPVRVNVNVPVSLLSKISVTYEQAKGDQEGICMRNVSVGTKISPPICLGSILNFSINMGLGITQTQDAMSKKTTYNAKPYCNANFSCALPFVSAQARLNEQGLTFDSTVAAEAGIPNTLVKVSTPPTQSYNIPLPKLPDPIKSLKSFFSQKKPASAGAALVGAAATDIFWEDLANPCALGAG